MTHPIGHILMRAGIWTIPMWLGMFYLGAGYTKLSQSPELLETLLGWTAWVSPSHVRLIGAAELLIGLLALCGLAGEKFGRCIFGVVAKIVLVSAVLMAGIHALTANLGLIVVNLVLFLLALAGSYGLARRKDRNTASTVML